MIKRFLLLALFFQAYSLLAQETELPTIAITREYTLTSSVASTGFGDRSILLTESESGNSRELLTPIIMTFDPNEGFERLPAAEYLRSAELRLTNVNAPENHVAVEILLADGLDGQPAAHLPFFDLFIDNSVVLEEGNSGFLDATDSTTRTYDFSTVGNAALGDIVTNSVNSFALPSYFWHVILVDTRLDRFSGQFPSATINLLAGAKLTVNYAFEANVARVSNVDTNPSIGTGGVVDRASDYAAFVSPAMQADVSSEEFIFDDIRSITFTAPSKLYLDASGEIIGSDQPTDLSTATRRVDCLGYSINGGAIINQLSYTPTNQVAFEITWHWSAPVVVENIVQVETPYGALQVSPPAGGHENLLNKIVEFNAPEFVYLDEFYNELPGTSAEIIQSASHRARSLGYVTNLTEFTGVDRTFRLPIESNVTVTWIWQLEQALEISSETSEVEGITPAEAAALGNPEPEIGKIWIPNGTLVSAEMDGIVDPNSNITFGDSVTGRRFKIDTYTLEGLRAPTDDQAVDASVTAGNYYVSQAETSLKDAYPLTMGAPDDFSLTGTPPSVDTQINTEQERNTVAALSFWGKIDTEGDDGVIEGLFSLGSASTSVYLTKEGSVMRLRAGWHAELFKNPVVLEMPASYFDDTWRFWTFAQVRKSGSDGYLAMAIRDGELVAQSTEQFLTFDRDAVYDTITFGQVTATVNNSFPYSQSGFYDVRVNNARLDASIDSDIEYISALRAFSLTAATVNAETVPVFASSDFSVIENGYVDVPSDRLSAEVFEDDVRLLLPTEYTFAFDTAQSRVNTLQFPMNGALNLEWGWDVEYRYVMTTLGPDGTSFDSLPYIEIFPEGTTQEQAQNWQDGDGIPRDLHIGSGQVWIEEDKALLMGTAYRSTDRRYTLNDFLASPTGNLNTAGREINNAVDEVHPAGDFLPSVSSGSVSRAYFIPSVSLATTANWLYQPTIFRAVVPVGEYLDASWQDDDENALSPLPANTQFFPDLPDGTRLAIDRSGPVLGTVADSEAEGVDLSASPIQWDFIGERLWPTKPYTFQMNWDAASGDESFLVEIVSDWPNSEVSVPESRPFENDNGNRLLASSSPADYLLTQITAEISPSFPGYPDIHYGFLFDEQSEKSPPLELDSTTADRWAFREMTFTETSGARPELSAPNNYSVNEAGRSVLVYNYHPDEQQVATGNPSVEAFAVRVIAGQSITDYKANGNTSVPQEPNIGGGMVPLHDVSEISKSISGFTPALADGDFALELWLNIETVGSTSATVFKLNGDPLQINLLGDGNLRDTATFEIIKGSGFFRIPKVAVTGWNYYSFNFVSHNGNETLEVYQNGVLLADGAANVFYDHGLASETVALFSGFTAGGWIGWADNVRFCSASLPEVELAKGRFYSALLSIDTIFYDNFDDVFNYPEYTFSPAGIQEVAQPLSSYLDQADFESGWILNGISNYNQNIYNRTSDVGQWGRIFPVNDAVLYADPNTQLEVVYYSNPSKTARNYQIATDGSSIENDLLHPNVAFPYYVQNQNDVSYPEHSADGESRIYISSRIGSEGVSASGVQQRIFKTDEFANLSIYNQSNRAQTGFNPNEEHALVAPSIRSAITTEPSTNIPPDAAFALQNSFNRTDVSVTTGSTAYTSQPWVLVQYDDLAEGRPSMKAYRVEAERSGALDFPQYDAFTNALLNPYTDGEAVEGAVYDFAYSFDYRVAAGDLLIPLYPLNTVIGAVETPGASGGNYQVNGVNQRTLWWDYKGNPYAVSGDGRFFYRYVYPFRSDFDMAGRSDVGIGDLLAFLPQDSQYKVDLSANATNVTPVAVNYSSFWGTDYPKLKRGETLTYQGGEYKADNPLAEGLPALVAMASAEIVYDNVLPEMVINDTNLNQYAARIVRPLDRYEVDFALSDMPVDLQPAATENVMVDGARWYFRNLTGSLSKRFYYDSLNQKLVLRGRLNGLESGDTGLTSAVEALNVLEPNFITNSEYLKLRNEPSGAVFDSASAADTPIGKWFAAVENLYYLSVNPEQFQKADESGIITPADSEFGYFPGLIENTDIVSLAAERDRMSRTFYDDAGNLLPAQVAGAFNPLNSFGVGSALVAGPEALLASSTERKYVTIAENNDERLEGAAVSLHIIELIPERYRGGLKVIDPIDAFSERINIQHNGEFGGNTEDIYYEWYIREAGALDVVADEVPTLGTAGQDVDWQLYATGTGLHSIQFEGRPDIALADQMFLMRYRHKDEPDNWNLVALDSILRADWEPATAPGTAAVAPFQWVGAANSPQLQADGSKRYIPQLVIGWVKRVLDQINPYEARYNDFYNNESPATYTSIIQSLGSPFIGSVALNSDKDVIEGVGLIELYETVLKRARDLTIDNSSPGAATNGTNQAILLAATRLSVFYDILGTEAYSDFLDPNLQLDDAASELASVASSIHAFENLEPNVLSEGLALLRGTDFLTSYPSYNRLFWNYTKGLGEAAYNTNYNITDENLDGFINEEDARALYPQGHGDAWGHYLSASNMHYELLNHSSFNWRSRDELYALLDNVIEVDFLDEKSFIKAAARKARAGRDIVAETYRSAYTHSPDGQWQGYEDNNEARAWGVGEWGRRAGQAAHFDFLVGNALLPESATESIQIENSDTGLTAEGIALIERKTAVDELSEISSHLLAIQTTVDQAAIGANPIGFHNEAISFDIDPYLMSRGETHFEQVYTKAVEASQNAARATTIATQAKAKLRQIEDYTTQISASAYDNDLAIRQRLVAIFGQPHPENVGFGKLYPEGYEGPDLYLYNYIEQTEVENYYPTFSDPQSDTKSTDGIFVQILNEYRPSYAGSGFNRADDGEDVTNDLYASVFGGSLANPGVWVQRFNRDMQYFYDASLDIDSLEVDAYYQEATVLNDLALLADSTWSGRPSYGELQQLLEEITIAQIQLSDIQGDYLGFLDDVKLALHKLENTVEIAQLTLENSSDFRRDSTILNSLALVAENVSIVSSTVADSIDAAGDSVTFSVPEVGGFSVSVGAPAKGATDTFFNLARVPFVVGAGVADAAALNLGFSVDILEQEYEEDSEEIEVLGSVQEALANIYDTTAADRELRYRFAERARAVELLRQQYLAKLNEGFAALQERESFNAGLAGDVQRNRYQDMMLRIVRNESQEKFKASYENAQRYVWLAAKAYEYEVNPAEGSPASAVPLLDKVVKASSVGNMVDGEPTVDGGGLSEILALLKANHAALEGQLGINNPQVGEESISLRKELFRIGDTEASNEQWQRALKVRKIDNLWELPEYKTYCRPFGDNTQVEPAILIEFNSAIQPGLNFFGQELSEGDHSFSSSNYSTKIAGLGVWFEGYDAAGLAATPRIYLVPTGADFMRTSDNSNPEIRGWSLVEQAIPTPYALNETDFTSPAFIPSFDGVDGTMGDLRRFADFRAYSSNATGDLSSQMIKDTRLIGRSVWNGEWMLIIPGRTLHSDPDIGIETFIENISDIQLNFETFTHRGL